MSGLPTEAPRLGEPEGLPAVARVLEGRDEERVKRGGVMYCSPGVTGAEEGGSLRIWRCLGVRGMSSILSGAANRG